MPVHLQVGQQNNVAIVLSCPGRYEEGAGYPAARTTGRNLNMLLGMLSTALGRADLTRINVTITNASRTVEYEEKTGRSQPTEAEVIAPDNLHRLERELRNVKEFVIFCGEMARAASERLRLVNAPTILYVEHLGARGLLSIKNDIGGEAIVKASDQRDAGRKESLKKIQTENTTKRLEVVARSLLAQLQV